MSTTRINFDYAAENPRLPRMVGCIASLIFVGIQTCEAAGNAPMSATESTGGEIALGTFSGTGGTETATVSADGEAAGLQWRYTFGANLPMVFAPLPAIDPAATGIALRLRSEHDTKIVLTVKERGGAHYEHPIALKARQWNTTEIPWNQFNLQAGKFDANQRLDYTELVQVILVDVGVAEGRKGRNEAMLEQIGIIGMASGAATPLDSDRWAQARATDIPKIAAGWSRPVLLPISQDWGWGDSIFVTPDGQAIYFMYYDGDLLTDQLKGGKDPYTHNADIYVSRAPFTTKDKDRRWYFVEDPWSAWGPMWAPGVGMFYGSNRDGMNDQKYDGDIYLDTTRLAFNTDDDNDNPHYCEALDELWMNRGKDEDILVLRQARKNNFSGQPELAPAPITMPNYKDTMPFLTADGQTLYFASDRQDPQGGRLAIYRSQRRGDGWSAPEPVIWDAKLAVGEPTLTADGKRLFYEQALHDSRWGYTTQFFYIERLD